MLTLHHTYKSVLQKFEVGKDKKANDKFIDAFLHASKMRNLSKIAQLPRFQ